MGVSVVQDGAWSCGGWGRVSLEGCADGSAARQSGRLFQPDEGSIKVKEGEGAGDQEAQVSEHYLVQSQSSRSWDSTREGPGADGLNGRV